MRILKALGSSLIGFLIVGLVGSMMTFLPNMDSPSIIGLIIVWSLSLIIAVSNFLNRLKPSLMTRFMIFFNIGNVFLAIAIHGLSILLSGWLWIAALLSVYIFVWVLPFINPPLAKYLNDLQYLLRPRPAKNRSSRLV